MEISNKINESYLNVEEINQTTGEVITLSSTSETSVQTSSSDAFGGLCTNIKIDEQSDR